MTIWNDIVLGVCCILLMFLVWGEMRRADRRRLAMRIVASALAVIALACLELPLTYMRGLERHPLSPVPVPGRTEGIVSVDWTRKPGRGDSLRVQGRLAQGEGKENNEGAKIRLLLTGMGEVLDSVEVPVRGGTFALGTIPAVIGRTVYHLVVVRVGSGVAVDTLEKEEVPVEVMPGRPLNILFLAASPDFENRFLIDWLSKGGHGIASRTRISRGKYDKAYVRLPELSMETLTSSLLDRFDLVIADAAELSSIGAGELSVLRKEVREKGMGLIIKTDSIGKKGLSLDGAGKILYTAVDTTYSQVLSGKERPYAAYWSRILGQVAREAGLEERWRIEPGLPGVGEPVRVWLQTGEGGLPQGEIGGMPTVRKDGDEEGRSVYLAEDAQLPFFWRGAFWPETAGWQFSRSLQGDTSWWYAWPRGAWGSLRQVKTLRVGEAGAGDRERKSDARGSRSGADGPMGAWFYGVFVICVLFLWAERKWKG
ncbi:MAG TPA: hypothetical protein VGM30_07245 [Puia sp.]